MYACCYNEHVLVSKASENIKRKIEIMYIQEKAQKLSMLSEHTKVDI